MEPLVLPMTEAQQGIWLSQQQLNDAGVYGVAEKINIEGPLDTQKWVAAANHVLATVPSLNLRLTDVPGDNLPHTVYAQGCATLASTVDLSQDESPRGLLEEEIARALSVPIDLQKTPVSHAILYRLSETEFCWFLRVHHLAVDGFGFALLGKALARAYLALDRQEQGTGEQKTALDSGTEWAENLERLVQAHRGLASLSRQESRDYWASQLPTEETHALTPAQGSRNNIRWKVGRFKHRLSPAHLALTSGILASILNREEEIVLGVHMMARNTRELLGTVCTSQNELPLCMNLTPAQTVNTALENLTRLWDGMSKHQMYRHENIRRDRNITGEQPLANIALNIVPFGQELVFGEATGSAEPVWDGPADIMTVDIRAMTAREHEISLLVPQGAVSDARAKACADLFGLLYRQIVEPASGNLSLAELLLRETPSPVEDWVAGDPEIFMRSLNSWAHDDIALSAPDAELTGHQVQERILALSHLLRSRLSKGDRVLLVLPRSTWAVLAPVASILSSITFVPTDTGWPADRLLTIADSARPALILTVEEYLPTVSKALADLDAELLVVDSAETRAEMAKLGSLGRSPEVAQAGGVPPTFSTPPAQAACPRALSCSTRISPTTSAPSNGFTCPEPWP